MKALSTKVVTTRRDVGRASEYPSLTGPVPGNGVAPKSADSVHASWGYNGQSGAGVHMTKPRGGER